MKTNQLTLRQLINLVECREGWKNKLFNYLYKKSKKSFATRKVILEDTTKAYSNVIEELKSKKPSKPNDFPIIIKIVKDFIDKKPFVDVCLLNPNYVAPKRGLLPWGGKNPPKGHYNCNDSKHNQYYAFGYSSWNDVIDTKIIVKTRKLKPWQYLGDILWELTWHGFTEKDSQKFNKDLKTRLSKAIKQIKKEK